MSTILQRCILLSLFVFLSGVLLLGPSVSYAAPQITQPTASSPSSTPTARPAILHTPAPGASVQQTATPAPPAAQPQVETIGQVVWTKGTVKALMPNKTERPLKRRDYLYEHDIVVTDKNSSGQIVFTDGSTMAVRESTKLKIDEYKFSKDAKPGEDKYVVSLAQGGFRTITGAIPKNNPQGYKVNTPVATIGIRGTNYLIVYGAKVGALVKVDVGEVSVGNSKGIKILNPQTSAFAQIVSDKVPPETSKFVPPNFQAIVRAQPALAPAPAPPPKFTPPPSGSPTTAAAAAGLGLGIGGGKPPSGPSGTVSTGESKSLEGGTVKGFCIGPNCKCN